jgi:hypothetical protein
MGDEPKGKADEDAAAQAPGALRTASRAVQDAGRRANETGRALKDSVVEHAAARIAAGLQPVRDIGRAVERQRIAVGNAVGGAASALAARARRTAWGVTLHGANVAAATGAAAWEVLWHDPFGVLDARDKFLEIRKELRDQLARYDAALAEAEQAERERLAVEAVERLKRWDHARTTHVASDFVHVSVGPGPTEAWGMVLRGPHAGRSLAALDRATLVALLEDLPDERTAQALEAWCHVLARAAPRAISDLTGSVRSDFLL